MSPVNTINTSAFFLIAILLTNLSSCKDQANEFAYSRPQEETVYVFQYKTRVKVENLDCDHLIQDDINDGIDWLLRKNLPVASLETQEEIGHFFHEDIIPYPIVHQHSKTEILNTICDNMEAFLPTPIDYEVIVVEAQTPNAFKTVGNYIYITTALIESIESDAALAFIIGHEIGHVENGNIDDHARVLQFCFNEETEHGHDHSSNDVIMHIPIVLTPSFYTFDPLCG